MGRRGVAHVTLALLPGTACAHTADVLETAAASVDLLGAVLLGLTAFVYARGQWQVARRSRSAHYGRPACFWAGWIALAVALGPPLDGWSALSFAAHMTQHEIMMLVAAPLLVIARPLGMLLWGLPHGFGSILKSRALRRVGAWLAAPLVAWLLHTAILWGWHVPAAFEAGLRSAPMHWLQHASFFGAAVLYWWSVFSSPAAARRGLALLSIFTTAVHTSVLGVLLTFSSQIWYTTYAQRSNPWGISALEDQQLGGLIMWVPGGMVFLAAGLALAALWLKDAEVRAAHEASTSTPR
jgi:cytochrome c oxidase assembly factor CtaG